MAQRMLTVHQSASPTVAEMYQEALSASCSIFLNWRNSPLTIISLFKNEKIKQGFFSPTPHLNLFLGRRKKALNFCPAMWQLKEVLPIICIEYLWKACQ